MWGYDDGIYIESSQMDPNFVPPSGSLNPSTSVEPPEPQWKKDRRRLAEILIDLDRCVHGRHVQDNCFSCPGENPGNPYLSPGQRIGTSLYGQPIVVPEWKDRYEPDAWIQH